MLLGGCLSAPLRWLPAARGPAPLRWLADVVAEAVVVVVPWSDTSDRHRAVIIPEKSCSPDVGELRRFAQRHLSAYKVPRSFRVRHELPRSATGKVLRGQLQELERAPEEGS